MLKKILLSILFLNLISCANNPFRSYKTESDHTLSNIYSGITESAVYMSGSDPDILYYMENGTYLRMLNRYQYSDKDLGLAQAEVDTWVNSWKNSLGGSLTTQTTQLLINDNATDYQPKGYEKTTLSAYRALNHIDLNNWQDARVEIKKMYQTEAAIKNYNEALYINARNEQSGLTYDARGSMIYSQIMRQYNLSSLNSQKVLLLKNSYQSAFSHYLAGFVFEALGEDSLARPGYLNALQLNPLNQLSQKSIKDLDNHKTQRSGYTNLLIIEEIGHAPQYKSHEIPINFNYNASNKNQPCDNQINVFFPELVLDRQGRQNYAYSIDNNEQTTELYTDYDLMAARYLHDQIPHLILRNIAAASRNIATSQAICNATDGSGGIGTIINMASQFGGSFLDKVDERSWVLLPSKIYLNRTQLAYGKHTINIEVMGRSYSKEITLNVPYQILDIRIMGSRVFLINQQ